MTRLRDRVAALEAENAALRTKLAAQRALDTNGQYDLKSAVGAVAHNVATLDSNDKRERVLLAVGVLYGIIQPRKPRTNAARNK